MLNTRLELRVHEETEKGDNETIKMKTPLAGRTSRLEKCA